MEGTIIDGLLLPTNLAKLLRKGMFVPIFKKLRPQEPADTYTYINKYSFENIFKTGVNRIGAHFTTLGLDLSGQLRCSLFLWELLRQILVLLLLRSIIFYNLPENIFEN